MTHLQPCNHSAESIEALAERFAQQFHDLWGLKIAGNLHRIASHLGGVMQDVDLHRSLSCVVVKGKCDWIYRTWECKSMTSTQSKIAHCLGHYILHSNQGAKPGYVGWEDGVEIDGRARMEWEATVFGNALAMSKSQMEGLWLKHKGDCVAIAAACGVTGEWCRNRIKQLKLMPD